MPSWTLKLLWPQGRNYSPSANSLANAYTKAGDNEKAAEQLQTLEELLKSVDSETEATYRAALDKL